jgi:uncharacterized protein (DUF1684 family)
MSSKIYGLARLEAIFPTLLVLAAISSAPAGAVTPPMGEAQQAPADHAAAMREWRQRRHERLSSEDGWLTLVGLEWLKDGGNRLGSGADSDIRLPGGPADWGTVTVDDDEITFVPAAGEAITVDDAPAAPARLVADNQGQPTVVRSGTLSFHVIYRGTYALRVKDSRAPTLLAFTGVDNYPIDAGWRFDARFIPAEPGQTIEIGDVLGQLNPMPVLGTVEFERDGQSYSLLGLAEEGTDSIWFLFADRTTGRETYGAGRFLYSDGMPENGRVVVDFNKAYNPPCAFTEYSTCPLPPQQNRLDLAVTAGEKDYHRD